jgi:hypothetical protein
MVMMMIMVIMMMMMMTIMIMVMIMMVVVVVMMMIMISLKAPRRQQELKGTVRQKKIRNPGSCKVTHYKFTIEEKYQSREFQGSSRNKTGRNREYPWCYLWNYLKKKR